MAFLRNRGKRGTETILYFRIICVIIAIGLFIITLSFVMDVYRGTLIIKNYKAKDMALLITTLYASPGNTSYEYALSGDFTVRIGNGLVSVSDKKGEYLYWYSKPAGIDDIVVNGIIPDADGFFEIEPPLDGRKIVFNKDMENKVLTAEVKPI